MRDLIQRAARDYGIPRLGSKIGICWIVAAEAKFLNRARNRIADQRHVNSARLPLGFLFRQLDSREFSVCNAGRRGPPQNEAALKVRHVPPAPDTPIDRIRQPDGVESVSCVLRLLGAVIGRGARP
jgi:hypothetical protein